MKKVLIIDDEDGIRNIYKKVFRALGMANCQVLEASNAVVATTMLLQEDVDLIVLDIKMPGIDGRTMFEVIKEYSPNIDVIIASVFPVCQQKDLCPGAKDYYDKSQGPFVFLNKLANVLLNEKRETLYAGR